MNRPLFALPPPVEFSRLGVVVDREIPGGHQSRVLLASIAGADGHGQVVLKLIQADPHDRALILERLRVRDEVAAHDDRVVPTVPLAGRHVNRIGDLVVIASPYVDGRPFDVEKRPDVERMGRALARLHQSLRLVHVELPIVDALAVGDAQEILGERHQLLHGDFAPTNLVLDADGRTWIFDFDACGMGPVEFELGNTLFMTLFDTSASLNQPSDIYLQFRKWFIGAYRASVQHPVSDALVDIALQARSDALRYWLTHLDEAPVGIRSADAEWHHHLRSFSGIMQQ